jgi:hypothetical protein
MDSMEQKQRPRRRSGGWSVLLTVIVAVALGGAGGALVAALTSGGSAAPPAPPELPADFPGAGGQSGLYLPDVTVSAIETWVADGGYECEVVTETQFEGRKSPRGAEHWQRCYAPMSFGSARADVGVEYDGEAQVAAVSAACERGPGTPEEYCPSVFREAADTVFASQPDVAQEAAMWAEENIDNDASTVVGGIELTVDLGEHRITFVPEL